MDKMAPGTPGYTDWRGRNRDIARYMYMYITGTRRRERGVHRQIWTSAYHRDPVGTGYLGEVIGEAQPLAVRLIHGPDRRTEKDVLNILNVSVHTERNIDLLIQLINSYCREICLMWFYTFQFILGRKL